MRLERCMLLVALASLALALFRFSEREKALTAELQRLSFPAMRSLVQDAMIGNPFPLESLGSVRAVDDRSGPAGIVWIVPTDDCRGCLRELQHWNDLASSGVLPSTLVLISASEAELAFAKRAVSEHTVIVHMSQDQGDALFGWMLPSTQLVVDRRGHILAADARASKQECGWSFTAQVGAQLGLMATTAIRGLPAVLD